MKKQRVFIFGNLILSADNPPMKVLPTLCKNFPQIEFLHVDPSDTWIENETNPILIDTVIGLLKPKLFNSLQSFEKLNFRITPHDYDLYFDLAIMLKLNKIEGFQLIGIPQKEPTKSMVVDVISILRKVLR